MSRIACETQSRSTMFPFRPQQPVPSTSTETTSTSSRRQKILNNLAKATSPSLFFNHTSPTAQNNSRVVPTLSSISGIPALPAAESWSGHQKKISHTNRSSIGTLDSDIGMLNPEANRWALRVINPDPDNSSEDEDEVKTDSTGTEPEPSNNSHINSSTPDHISLPVLPTHEEGTSADAKLEYDPTMDSHSQFSHSHHQSPTTSFLSMPPPPLVRRQSKTLEEGPPQTPPLETLPPIELPLHLFGKEDGSLTPNIIIQPPSSIKSNQCHSPQAVSPSLPHLKLVTSTSHSQGIMLSSVSPTAYASHDNVMVNTAPNMHPMARMEERTLPSWYQGSSTPVVSSTFSNESTIHTKSSHINDKSDEREIPKNGVHNGPDTKVMVSQVQEPANPIAAFAKTSTNMAALTGVNQLSKYAKASYSLTNNPNAIKLYRNQALKTGDPGVQLSYAKYLLEIASLYDHSSKSNSLKPLSLFGLSSSISGGRRKSSQVGGGRTSMDTRPSSSATSPGLASQSDIYSSARVAPSLDYDQRQSISSGTVVLGDETSRRKKKLLEEEGIRWVKRLAKEGVGEAAYMQAVWIDRSLYGLKKSASKTFRLFNIAAKEGIPEAIYALALHYEKERNFSEAFNNFKDAADKNLPEAMFKMAKINLHGELNQRQNTVKGLQLLQRVIDMGSDEYSEPLYLFGLILTNTYPKVDIPQQLVEPYGGLYAAIVYFERAARSGHTEAQGRLGYIYEHGMYGVPVNLSKSVTNYEAAARNGNPQAMLGLSRLYNRGSHGPDDRDEKTRLELDESGWLQANPRNEDLAFSWCQRAAEKGLADAMWYYEMGIGVPRDHERAITYYKKASIRGHPGAEERLAKTNSGSRQQYEDSRRGNYLRYTQDGNKENQPCTVM
ncbi:hypothetical protein PHYBLDRAFT_181004 [Phycomyces blakesleeanus NRRL 1555(-)]|uniref:Uncharacterized protein n=1 Tax=Phycomyces blakesleeanus (strain ATCC 8743b / DSM 1359 / FGSC 10004 / NBRC 33097 / NRRL 1555) TaxID=763407 RepID=A0A167N4L7_PHYB8|nr:hypothetical protein PHYBLDRAFT_181004 [Phycomyces blakesleeanus NRRL 1555(-)]OAD74979.1 hypothetical protein PHYBLDRAFT_181004 [Phycomyces blakesleeanus NRRL 1555(-)]|eukprot:XP_018293019.1 hypothetical protein PHYBLDRAFT_181004 [Phycomyces blakesleeanus NRRL 1555(-)]